MLKSLVFLLLIHVACLSALEVTPKEQNLGIVPDSQEVLCRFQLRNNTDKPVEILSAETSCSCAHAKVLQKHLLPGEKTTLEILFDPREKTGHIRWETKIYTSNSASYATATFELEVLKNHFISDEFVSLGNIDISEAFTKDIWISPQNVENFQLTSAHMAKTQSAFKVEITTEKYSGFYPAPREAHRIRLTLNKNVSQGRVDENLEISTNLSGYEKIVIPVVGKITGKITANRDKIKFGRVSKKRGSLRRIIVFSVQENRLFQIQELKSSLPLLTLKVKPIIENKYFEVIASIKKEASLGKFRGEIKIITDLDETIVLPVDGTIVP